MRSINYVRAYAEHLASRTLIWAAATMVAWVIGVSILDPLVRTRATTSPAKQDSAPAAASPTGVKDSEQPSGDRAGSSDPVKHE